MATINMEVEVTSSLKTTMDDKKQTMESKLGELTNTITSMIDSAWEGLSAREFNGQYESLRSAIAAQVEKITQLSTALQNEITEWVTAAQKMG